MILLKYLGQTLKFYFKNENIPYAGCTICILVVLPIKALNVFHFPRTISKLKKKKIEDQYIGYHWEYHKVPSFNKLNQILTPYLMKIQFKATTFFSSKLTFFIASFCGFWMLRLQYHLKETNQYISNKMYVNKSIYCSRSI